MVRWMEINFLQLIFTTLYQDEKNSEPQFSFNKNNNNREAMTFKINFE